MNKYQKFSIFLLFFVAIGVVLFKSNRVSLSPTATPQPTEIAQDVRLILDVDGQKQTLDASLFINRTALAASQKLANIEVSGNGENAFVTSINGRSANDSKHEFWELLVNGNPAQVGAGSYIIKSGDIIEWHLSTY